MKLWVGEARSPISRRNDRRICVMYTAFWPVGCLDLNSGKAKGRSRIDTVTAQVIKSFWEMYVLMVFLRFRALHRRRDDVLTKRGA